MFLLVAADSCFRYVQQTAQQAIIQKSAWIITGLRAGHALLKQGLLQEQAVIERVVDEFHEDVLFLSYGILKGETETHKTFLGSILPRGI